MEEDDEKIPTIKQNMVVWIGRINNLNPFVWSGVEPQ